MRELNKISLDTIAENQWNMVQLMAQTNDPEKIEILLGIYKSLENLKQFAS